MKIYKFSVGKYRTNCYCVLGEDYAFVIDPAYPAQDVLEFAKNNAEKKYRYIILTHCHIDHIEGVNAVKTALNCSVIISKDDESALADPKINLSQMLFGYDFLLSPDFTVQDGDKIIIGNDEINVMATPGHTLGSVCYIVGDSIFSGDTLFNGTIGRTDLPTSDGIKMRESLKKLYDLKKDYKVYSGHGDDTTLNNEKKYNCFMRF